MSAIALKTRMQRWGNIQLISLLVIVIIGGWYLNRELGGVFAAVVFLGTIWWASQSLYAMYDLDSRLEAFDALLAMMLGINLPTMIIGEGRIIKKSSSRFPKAGGPGMLIINNDSVVVTEKGASVNVHGPGVHLVTSRGERMKEIVDLRPQARSGTIKAMSKDGFDIEVDYFVGFQIDPGDRHPTEQEPYPFSEQAVLRAVYGSKQVAKDGAQLWHERVPNAAFAFVREMIATHYLEDFIKPDDPKSDPRSGYKKWLTEKTKEVAKNFGAQVNWVNFSTPRVPDDTTRQFVERWQVALQSQMQVLRSETQSKVRQHQANLRVIEAEAEANANAVKIKKAAEAQTERIRQIAEELKEQKIPAETIAKILEEIAGQPSEEELDKLFRRFGFAIGGASRRNI